MLGICHGAQLLAASFGGAIRCRRRRGAEPDRFDPRPRRELTESGARSPMSFAHRRGLYR
ncbi:hypothetical protein ACFTZB_29820 [Rhodococcus sp. NPDC057014]|uniref:hypothetical protein n=1 Tax=unclassified Rhodococcus (in: high G+C Gram-positive bacteria) TaxID=192944 RepID=UPI0036256AD9